MNIRYGFGLRNAAINMVRRTFVRAHTKHLYGPKHFSLGDCEVALILLGRNIMHSAPYFFDYYKSRGITKFVYLDNGSTDGSEHYFAKQSNVIVAQCLLNFRDYQSELRYCVASDYTIGGWRLAVDADELLDYPCSGTMAIPDLVAFLVARGYTGCIAQMLEMVPHGSLRKHETASFSECVKNFTKYSTDAIDFSDYHSATDPLNFFAKENTLTNPAIKLMRGGLRKVVFDENCLLTKHFLFSGSRDILPLPHPHFSCGLNIADFTAVLYHYKFAGRYFDREKALDSEGRLSHDEGKKRLRASEAENDIQFDFAGLREKPTIPDLLAQGFLVAPPFGLT